MKRVALLLLFAALLGYGRVWYVSESGNDTASGASWSDALKSPQVAIEHAEAGDSVWIASGRYQATALRSIEGEQLYAASFLLKSGVSIYGGFAGNENALSQRQVNGAVWNFTNATVLESTDSLPGSVLYGGETPFASKVVIDGLTLRNGRAVGTGRDGCGGGANLSGNCELQRCIVEGNSAIHGSGVHASGDTMIRQCLVKNNCSLRNGWSCKGGGVYLDGATMENCVIWENGVNGNVVEGGGCHVVSGMLRHCTIVGNCAKRSGGVHFAEDGAMENCIVWGNGGIALQLTQGNARIAHSAIEGILPNGDNILLESDNCGELGSGVNENRIGRYYACFEAPEEGDFRLAKGSYLINRGMSSAVTSDAFGERRVMRGVPDIGAFESTHPGNIAVEMEIAGPCVYGGVSEIDVASGTLTPDGIMLEFSALKGNVDLHIGDSAWEACWLGAGDVSLLLEAYMDGNTNWNGVSAEYDLQVSRRPIVIAAEDAEFSYNEEMPELNCNVIAGSLAPGDAVAGELAVPDNIMPGRIYPISQGTVHIIDGASGDNYSMIFLDGELSYFKANVDFEVTVGDMVYTGTRAVPEITLEKDVAYTVSFIGVDGTEYGPSGTPPTDAGSYKLIIAFDSDCYEGCVERFVQLKPTLLTVTADSKARVQGMPNPVLTMSYSGFRGNDTQAAIVPPEISTTADVNSPSGKYPISLNGGSARNYVLQLVDGVLTVDGVSEEVAADSIVIGNPLDASILHGTFMNSRTEEQITGHFEIEDEGTILPAGTWTKLWRFIPDDTENYTTLTGSVAVEVRKRRMVVRAEDKSSVYGEEEVPLTYVVVDDSEVEEGDVVEVRLKRTHGVDVGDYEIDVADGSGNDKYDVECEKGVYSITKRPLGIMIKIKSHAWGDNADEEPMWQIVEGSLVGNSYVTGEIYRDEGSEPGTYNVHGDRLTVNDYWNYEISYTSYPMIISKRNVTLNYYVTYNAVYGTPLRDIEIRATGLDIETREPVAGTVHWDYSLYDEILPVGTASRRIFFDPAESTHYSYSFKTFANVIVSKAPLTVSLAQENYERYYGEDNPAFDIVCDGFVNGEDTGVFDTPPVAMTSAVASSPVGTYPISISVPSADNYDVQAVPGTLTVKKRPVVGQMTVLNATAGQLLETANISASFKDAMNGTTVSGSVSWNAKKNDPAQTIIGNGLSDYYAVFTPDNENYQQVEQLVHVAFGEKQLRLKLLPSTRNYALPGEEATETFNWRYDIENGSVVPTENVSFKFVRDAGEDVGEYRYRLASWSGNDGYYVTVDDSEAVFSITPRSVIITPVATQKVYGDDDPVIGYTADADVGNMISGVLSRDEGENVGAYAVRMGTLAPLNSNINLTVNAVTFTISPRPITIQATSFEVEYGDDFPETAFVITDGNLVGDDQFVIDDAPAWNPCPGEQLITLDNVSLNDNYALTRIPGVLKIVNRRVTVQADDAWKLVGTEDPALTYSVVEGSFAPNLVVWGTPERAVGEEVGEYEIGQGTLLFPAFHDVTFIGGSFKIYSGESELPPRGLGNGGSLGRCITVSTEGGEGKVPSIEAALALAEDGWTIFIEPGVYEGDVWIVEKSVDIEGVADSNGALPIVKGCFNFNGDAASYSKLSGLRIESANGPAVVIGYACVGAVVSGNDIHGRNIDILSDNRDVDINGNTFHSNIGVLYTVE